MALIDRIIVKSVALPFSGLSEMLSALFCFQCVEVKSRDVISCYKWFSKWRNAFLGST